MIRYTVAVFFLLGIFGCAQTEVAKQVRPDHLTFPALTFEFPQVEKQQLDNGLQVYFKDDHELPLVDLTLKIGGGSIDEPLEKAGLSTIFAKTLETGGAGELSPLELEAELEAMAAELTVDSSTYYYQVSLSLHQNDLERGLEILADLVRRPGFDPERMELARKQLLESIRRKNDSPGAVAQRLLHEAMYPNHPFGNTPQVESVEAITVSDLQEIHKQSMRPDNLWLAVSGAVSQKELLTLLKKNFSDWQATTEISTRLPELPTPPAGKVLMAEKEIPQTTILLGHTGISKDNPDLFALRIANFILGGGGFNSRMMREIRSNRGLAYSVYSYFEIGRRLPELFVSKSETKCETTVEVVSLMRQMMKQIREEPVTKQELELAKRSLINSFVFAFSDTHSIVSRKVRLDFFAYPDDFLETYREKIAAVTIEDVQRVAQKYLKPDDLQIVLVGDSKLFSNELSTLGLPIEKVEL